MLGSLTFAGGPFAGLGFGIAPTPVVPAPFYVCDASDALTAGDAAGARFEGSAAAGDALLASDLPPLLGGWIAVRWPRDAAWANAPTAA